jgi:hypothetical protein
MTFDRARVAGAPPGGPTRRYHRPGRDEGRAVLVAGPVPGRSAPIFYRSRDRAPA